MPSLSRPTADETDSSFGGNRSDRSNVIRDARVIGEPFSGSSCGPETGSGKLGGNGPTSIGRMTQLLEKGDLDHEIGQQAKSSRSRYVPVGRNFVVSCVFGGSKNQ